MKKIILISLIIILLIIVFITLRACLNDNQNDSVLEGPITEEMWQKAINEQKFNNVTINYTFNAPEGLQTHIVKITETKIYRKMDLTTLDGKTETKIETTLIGNEADKERRAFMKTFFAFLEKKENFIYESNSDVYIAPNEVSVNLNTSETITAKEIMKNGKVKFDSDGQIVSVSFTQTESIYNGENLMMSTTGDVCWNFSNYGTTLINSN